MTIRCDPEIDAPCIPSLLAAARTHYNGNPYRSMTFDP